MKKLNSGEMESFLIILSERFDSNMSRHRTLKWNNVLSKLRQYPDKLLSLYQMETTGGEPDVVGFDENNKKYTFIDCAAESPKGRRSVCYDLEGLESRKTHKPKNNAVELAKEWGIELLSTEEYMFLQELGEFDLKSSSWLQTSSSVRELGGAIFGDRRYGRVFIYHNGAQSYYANRGFRGSLKV